MEPIVNFSELMFSVIMLGSIAGVGATLFFLLGIFLKELRSNNVW